jgi:hypothetical protein
MVAPGRRGFDPRLALPVNASNEGRVRGPVSKKNCLGSLGKMENIVGWFLREGGNPKKSGPQPTEKKARLSVTYEQPTEKKACMSVTMNFLG